MGTTINRIERHVDGFTLVWQGPVVTHGRTWGDGQGHPGDPPDNRPGEHSYDELYYVASSWVEKDGEQVSPKIVDFAFVNWGWCVTWAQTHWLEGFVICEGEVAFVSMGPDRGYHLCTGAVHSLAGGNTSEMTRDELNALLGEGDDSERWRDTYAKQLLGTYIFDVQSFMRDSTVTKWNQDKVTWHSVSKVLELTGA